MGKLVKFFIFFYEVELLFRQNKFCKNSFRKNVKVLHSATPCAEFLAKISSESAKNYINSLPLLKKDFKEVFKGANLLAIQLLELMLEFDSDKRVNAEQALAHPYLLTYVDPSDVPISPPYDQSFEDMDLPVEQWKEYVYDEVKNFMPHLELQPNSAM